MSILHQNALVIVAVETTKGTPVTGLVTSGTIQSAGKLVRVINPEVTPDITHNERKFARPDLAQYPMLPGRRMAKVKFEVELTGSGTADVAPPWAVLLQGCAMATSSTTGSTQIYYPVSQPSAQQSLTMWVYYDNLLHKVSGAVGTFQMSAEAGNHATLTFDFTGVYNDPVVDTYPSTYNFTETDPALVENATFSVFGLSAPVIKSFKFDAGNKIVPTEDMTKPSGYSYFRVSERKPKADIDPEVNLSHVVSGTPSPNAFFNKLSTGAVGSLSIQLAAANSGIIAFASGHAQVEKVTYADRDNFRVYNVSLGLTRDPSNPDQDFSISFQ